MQSDLLFLFNGKPADYVIKTFSTAMANMENGSSKDVYFDDLLQKLPEHVKIEEVNNVQFHKRSANSIFPPDLTTIWHDLMVDRLARIGHPARFRDLSQFLADLLRRELDVTAQNIHKSVLEFYWSKRYYKKLFKRLQSRYLFLADIGQTAPIAAARELGMKTIEFQHGFLDRSHPGYSWSSYAVNRKMSMPVPDRLFLYGSHWQSELSTTGFWKDELCVVGSLRMDDYRKKTDHVAAHPLRMILTTQGIDTDALIGFFLEFARLAQHLNYELFVKLHPIFDKDPAVYIKSWNDIPRIHVIAGDQSPNTLDLISSAQVHLSIFSTCHYESLGLGVPTLILGLAGHENMLHLEEQGVAHVVRSPHELLKLMEFPERLELPEGAGELYFKSHAMSNMLREIELLQ
jgi:hypothetical protein